MHVVDDVRRRLIESTCRELIDQAVPLNIFSRDVIVDGLVLCGGSIDQFNTHYNAWRKTQPKVILRSHKTTEFLDFVRSRVTPSPVDDGCITDELMERSADIAYLRSRFTTEIFTISCAAKCLCACDGDVDKLEEILERVLRTFSDTEAASSLELIWNVERMYKDRLASLREDWRKPAEVLDAR